jgi:hypothetical protein
VRRCFLLWRHLLWPVAGPKQLAVNRVQEIQGFVTIAGLHADTDARSRYYEYAPLFHLLPKPTLDRFGLPLVCRGQWPFLADWRNVDRFLPRDFAQSLSRAWAATVWPHLNSGSRLSAFSADDPIRLLARNLDFWLPPVTTVIQELLGEFPLVDKGKTVSPVPLADGGCFQTR